MLMKTLTSLSMRAAQVTSLHKGRFKFLHYLSVRWKYANGVPQNTRTHYIHKLVYRVKRFKKSPNRRRNWTDCQVKPKLISYMLMKSLTFFSLVAARASQVYTKTVNSGLFTRFTRPHKDRKRWLILMEGIIQGTRTFNNSDLKLQHLTRRRTDI